MNFLKNIALQEGDYIVCITESWKNFSYGKKYRVDSYKTKNYDIVNVLNNYGDRDFPCYCGIDGNYFITLQEWREMQIFMVVK